MFMPNIAATKEYIDKQTVPELRKSSSCRHRKGKIDYDWKFICIKDVNGTFQDTAPESAGFDDCQAATRNTLYHKTIILSLNTS